MSTGRAAFGAGALQIRQAEVEDMPQIAKLGVKLARQHNGYDAVRFVLAPFEPLEQYHLEYLTGQIRREDTSFLVAVLEGNIVGYAFLRVEPRSFIDLVEKGAWLHDIYFDESIQGTGFGKRFFDAVIDEAKKLGSNFLMLSVSPKNIAGQRFFAKMGFRSTMQEMRLDV